MKLYFFNKIQKMRCETSTLGVEVTEIDYEIFSLPKKEVKILDKYMFKDKQLRLKIRWKVINHKCPKCGTKSMRPERSALGVKMIWNCFS